MSARIAFVTMVRDEPVFLPLWVRHYAAIAPRAQLFILFDGLDQQVPDAADGCQVLRLPQGVAGPGWDDARWRMLSGFANTLLERFDVVVLNDVDELIVLDPEAGDDLAAAFAEAADIGVISPFAIELVHRTDLEPEPLNLTRPLLAQRRHGRINASYCKPCIVARKVIWSLGGHYSDFPTLHLSRKLFLFHLRAMDAGLLRDRQVLRRAHVADAGGRIVDQVAGQGWSRTADEMDAFLTSFQDRPPEVSDFRFDWQRQRIEASWAQDPATGLWRHDRLHNRRSYILPDRFSALIQTPGGLTDPAGKD